METKNKVEISIVWKRLKRIPEACISININDNSTRKSWTKRTEKVDALLRCCFRFESSMLSWCLSGYGSKLEKLSEKSNKLNGLSSKRPVCGRNMESILHITQNFFYIKCGQFFQKYRNKNNNNNNNNNRLFIRQEIKWHVFTSVGINKQSFEFLVGKRKIYSTKRHSKDMCSTTIARLLGFSDSFWSSLTINQVDNCKFTSLHSFLAGVNSLPLSGNHFLGYFLSSVLIVLQLQH